MTEPDPEVLERARGPRRYSVSYKARILESPVMPAVVRGLLESLNNRDTPPK